MKGRRGGVWRPLVRFLTGTASLAHNFWTSHDCCRATQMNQWASERTGWNQSPKLIWTEGALERGWRRSFKLEPLFRTALFGRWVLSCQGWLLDDGVRQNEGRGGPLEGLTQSPTTSKWRGSFAGWRPSEGIVVEHPWLWFSREDGRKGERAKELKQSDGRC